MRVFSINRQKVKNTAWMEAILALDRINMNRLFKSMNLEMPVERRKRAFEHPGTIIAVVDETETLIGYLEYGPGWEDPTEIYISSIQVAPGHQNGSVLRPLLRYALRHQTINRMQPIRTHVQKDNTSAIRMYERLGFSIDWSSEKNGTLRATLIGPPKWPISRAKK